MKYHNITKDDMLNGDGIRVVLWVSGCSHHCKGCQNPITWNPDDGLEVTTETWIELTSELEKDYVSGITFSGGDPLHPDNRKVILFMAKNMKKEFPGKTIWMYSGYTWEQIMDDESMKEIMMYVDVLVDGKFEEDKLDKQYHWAGSTNQRIIDVQKSIGKGKVVLHESSEEGWNSGSIQFTENCKCSS